jgi:sugar-specific transcriptional regulator TrmB
MQSDQDRNLIDTLRRLGFSDLEALIYLDLLRHPSSTGYRIGRSISKPHANVYQSLVSLEQKGAVLFEEGETRIYSAVPPAELIGHLRVRYERECAAAERELKALEVKPAEEDRFFRLTSRDQVYARARTMLEEAQETILIEMGPVPAEELRANLQEAAARGVAIAGLTLREADLIEGTRIIVSKLADRLERIWPGDQLTLIIDGREFLLALFDKKSREVKRAIWVNSHYVATILNNGIVGDILLHDLPAIKELESPNRQLFGRLPPGFRELLETPDEGSGE